MARGMTRTQTKAVRTIAALLALTACLFQSLVAFGSLKAQAWSTDDTGQGLIVLLLLVFILFAMLVAVAAMLVSPETARMLGAVAVVLDIVVVAIALGDTPEATTARSLTDGLILLAAPAAVLALSALLVKLEGGRLFR